MDYWVRGSGKKFAWRDVLKTLDDSTGVKAADTKAVIQDREGLLNGFTVGIAAWSR